MYAALRALGVYDSNRLIEEMIQERSKAELGTITTSTYHSRSPVVDYHPETKTRQLYLVRGSGARE